MGFLCCLPSKRTAISYLKAFCWLGAFCSAVTFWFFFWITPTRFAVVYNAHLLAFYRKLIIYYKWIPAGHAKTALLSGTNLFEILWQFVCTASITFFGTILLAIELYEIRGRYRGPGRKLLTASENDDDSFSNAVSNGTNANKSSMSSGCSDWTVSIRRSRVMRIIRRVLFYQLPPSRFWFWFCDGFTVLDLLLVLSWFMWHLMGIRELALNRYNRYAVSHVPSPPPKMKSPPGLHPPTPPSPPPIPPTAAGLALIKTYKRNLFNNLNYSIMQMMGQVIRLDLLVLFYPVARSSFLHWLTGSDFPTLVRYHRWMGYGCILACTIHGIMALGYYNYNGGWANVKANITFLMTRDFNTVAGLVSLISGWMILVTVAPWIRRRQFRVFHYAHILFAFTFVLFAFMHKKTVLVYCAPGIVFYLFDVVMRHSQQWYNRTIVSSAINAKLNADSSVVSLNILCDKTFNWVGSDIIFLYAPEISWWQWHPFTTTSAAIPACAVEGSSNSDVRVLQIQIKKYDRWTRDLINRLQNSAAPLTISLSGPYHGAARKWLNYDSLLLIGGGIGATPLLGILRDMIALRAAGVNFGGKDGLPRKVKFIWLCRNGEEFGILGRDILEEMRRPNSWLQIELCNTSKQDGKQVDGTVAVAVTSETSKGEEDSIRSRIESNPLTNPFMGGHPFIYLFSLLLSLGGGIGGILLAYTYDVNRTLKIKKRHDFSFIGMLQLACLIFGATIPPLVFMLIVRTINVLLAHRRRATASLVVNDIQDKAVVYAETKDAVSRVSTDNMEDAYAEEDGKSSSKVIRLVPTSVLGSQIDHMNGLGQVMGGPLEALMSWGRPNFSNILKGFAEEAYSCEPNSDVGVFVGGPEPMVRVVMNEVTSLNSIFGSNTRAHLDAYPLTHSL